MVVRPVVDAARLFVPQMVLRSRSAQPRARGDSFGGCDGEKAGGRGLQDRRRVGVSETSWEDAGRNAVETAAGSLRDLRVAEVTKMDMKVENGKVAGFRTRVALSFKYEA